jgi:23S rRNA (cytosine1962-C5)-methyltransferase
MTASLEARISAAIARRAPLWSPGQLTALRLVNGAADGIPGATVDRFEQVAVVSLYVDLDAAREAELVAAVAAVPGIDSVYLKRRPKEARVEATVRKDALAPEAPAAGVGVPSLWAYEGGLAFEIRPAQGLGVGLYLDMRPTRLWLREQVRGATVLNLFAYTCGFGLVAHAGGAARAANVDASRRVLDWGAENLRHAGIEPNARDFIAGDAFDWLARFAKKGERFDVVVLDPPSFATTRHSRFSAARDYASLVRAAAPVVAPGGLLVACCNLAQLSRPAFEARVEEGLEAASRRGRVVERLGASPVDFPSGGGEGPVLKVDALRLT